MKEEKKDQKTAPAAEKEPRKLILTSSPHIRSKETIEESMYTVTLALLPAMAGAIYFFGFDALRVLLWCVGGCLCFEALCLRLARAKGIPRTLVDGSAILTALLLAMNLPSNAPWWLALAGSFIAMILGKHVFGGIGANIFNPALVARVFLLIAWPARMTSWPTPFKGAEGVTGATPLGVLATDGLQKMTEQFPLMDVILGKVGGSLGETSAILLLLGGVVLIVRGVIRWETPVCFIATVGLLSTIAWAINPETMANPLFHLAAGGLFLGAFFMATDYVTSPLSSGGMIVFGIGCGFLTFIIRFFGSFPEGVSFAILIMNSLVPLIDRYFTPRRFGRVKEKKSEA